jgi:hypothetical protein
LFFNCFFLPSFLIQLLFLFFFLFVLSIHFFFIIFSYFFHFHLILYSLLYFFLLFELNLFQLLHLLFNQWRLHSTSWAAFHSRFTSYCSTFLILKHSYTLSIPSPSTLLLQHFSSHFPQYIKLPSSLLFVVSHSFFNKDFVRNIIIIFRIDIVSSPYN